MYQMAELLGFSLIHGFSHSADGNMSFKYGDTKVVRNNRRVFFNRVGLRDWKAGVYILPHNTYPGNDVVRVGGGHAGIGSQLLGGVDAECVISTTPGLALCINVADCVPIIVYDYERNIVALVHGSRKNVFNDILFRVFDYLRTRFRSDPASCVVAMGPCIKKESYIVPQVYVRNIGNWDGCYIEPVDGGFRLDLPGILSEQAVLSGVMKENIYVSHIDTGIDISFFSHYRAKMRNEPEGRFLAVVALAE